MIIVIYLIWWTIMILFCSEIIGIKWITKIMVQTSGSLFT